VVFECGSCGASLESDQVQAGELVACPACGHRTFVRDPAPQRMIVWRKRPVGRPAAGRPKLQVAAMQAAHAAGCGPIMGGWLCYGLALVGAPICIFLPIMWLGEFACLLVALIMAIVLLVKNELGHGLVLLLAVLFSPAVFFILHVGGLVTLDAFFRAFR
jgi:DNA-directed RNA polymerase subunit RPC12/RpoP